MQDKSAILFDQRSQALPQVAEPNISSLEAKGVNSCGHGTLTLRGKSAELFAAIDGDVQAFAASLGAERAILPASLHLESFRRSGYLSLFPHLVSLLSTIDTEASAFADLRNKLGPADHAVLLAHLKEPEHVCSSAVCLSSYPCFNGKVFRPEERITLTATGRAFRREKIDPKNPLRLVEFNVREIIFFGSADFVRDSLAECVGWMRALLQEAELKGSIQLAEDPFFAPEAKALAAYQRAAKSKYELLLQKTNAEDVAVASINNHETHFSKAYEMKFPNGEYIHTGCFAVGLERLLLMLFYQYGFDESRWPKGLRKRFTQ